MINRYVSARRFRCFVFVRYVNEVCSLCYVFDCYVSARRCVCVVFVRYVSDVHSLSCLIVMLALRAFSVLFVRYVNGVRSLFYVFDCCVNDHNNNIMNLLCANSMCICSNAHYN